MKKIIAFALAFVMVFAVAATAMAAVGITVVDLPSTPDIGITVEKLKADEDIAGNAIWTAMGASEGIRPNKNYAVKITVTVPKNYSYTDPTWLTVAVSGAAKAEIVGVTGSGAAAIYAQAVKPAVADQGTTPFGAGTMVAGTKANTFTTEATTYPAKNETGAAVKFTYVIDFWSIEDTTDEVETNDAEKITVRVGLTDDTYGTDLDAAAPWVLNTGYNIVVGGKDYLVFKSDILPTPIGVTSVTPAVWYGITNKGITEGVVLACGAPRTDSYSEVASVYVSYDGVLYRAYVDIVGGSVVFDYPGDAGTTRKLSAGDTGYAAVKAVLDKYLGVMGWSFSGSLGWVCDKDFTKLSGYTGEKVVTAVFAPYILTLTVTGPATTVPDTGDMNVVGIVMIAVAILTTAAIAIRKVRA